MEGGRLQSHRLPPILQRTIAEKAKFQDANSIADASAFLRGIKIE
jgi:hypothetical protein